MLNVLFVIFANIRLEKLKMEEDEIIDQKVEDTVKFFLIKKIEGLSIVEKWQPETMVSKELIVTYYKKIAEKGKLVHISKKTEALFEKFSAISDVSVIDNVQKWYFTKKKIELPSSKLKLIHEKLLKLKPSFCLTDKVNTEKIKHLRKEVILETIIQKRKKQLENLAVLKEYISANSNHKIEIENNVDLEVPSKFEYINNCRPTSNCGIESINKAKGCECSDCSVSSNCCFQLQKPFHSELAYYNKKLRSKFLKFNLLESSIPWPIYECNDNCKCPSTCPNKLVQNNSEVEFVLFRTDECGFGVRSKKFIKKATFVARYVGEIISSVEINDRIKKKSVNIFLH